LERVELFKNNPFEPKLRTHKLSGKLKDLWSFSLEYDLRVIFSFASQARVIFVDIGSHKEVY
jgi:addiction module RelE/StbE family toxin